MSEFIIQIEKLFSAVGDPEYRYLLLEPLIFYGLFIGVIVLIVGFSLKAYRLQTTALAIIGVAALAHFPYKEARLAAQPRMEQVYRISTPSRVRGFTENTSAWIATSWQFRLLILCAGATLMVGVQRNRLGFGLAVATMLLSLLAAKNAMWLNYQDAIAYHPNLKTHEAPIDKSSLLVTPPPSTSRRDEHLPANATSKPIAPASLAPSSGVASGSQDRISPPPTPSIPRAREIQPLTR